MSACPASCWVTWIGSPLRTQLVMQDRRRSWMQNAWPRPARLQAVLNFCRALLTRWPVSFQRPASTCWPVVVPARRLHEDVGAGGRRVRLEFAEVRDGLRGERKFPTLVVLGLPGLYVPARFVTGDVQDRPVEVQVVPRQVVQLVAAHAAGVEDHHRRAGPDVAGLRVEPLELARETYGGRVSATFASSRFQPTCSARRRQVASIITSV